MLSAPRLYERSASTGAHVMHGDWKKALLKRAKRQSTPIQRCCDGEPKLRDYSGSPRRPMQASKAFQRRDLPKSQGGIDRKDVYCEVAARRCTDMTQCRFPARRSGRVGLSSRGLVGPWRKKAVFKGGPCAALSVKMITEGA